jgi:Transposase DDE domain
MVGRKSVCLRRLAGGRRREIVRFGRFLSNPRVTVERLIEGWGAQTATACAGRHVLAIQDTSDFNFRTTAERRRGLGEIGKGVGRGLLLHAMLAVDADTYGCLGLVSGRLWTRPGRRRVDHGKRSLADKESQRWLSTAEAAKSVLAAAASVTVVADRESDIYAEWARLPGLRFHLLTRAMHDRVIAEGGRLSTAALERAGEAEIDLAARAGRPARRAKLAARFGRVTLKRPQSTREAGLPKTVPVSLVEVVEQNPPPGVEPILWRLLTTHEVTDAAMAWRVIGWYRARWIIEQLFRTLKQQGLRVENSQLETAEGLLKLTAIAARAACTTLQLVQARDGRSNQSTEIAFTPAEVRALEALLPGLEGKTAAQKNPHPRRSLAWAAWIIAKLGGWDGYKSSKPPGPITFRHGLEHFHSIAYGWSLRDV